MIRTNCSRSYIRLSFHLMDSKDGTLTYLHRLLIVKLQESLAALIVATIKLLLTSNKIISR